MIATTLRIPLPGDPLLLADGRTVLVQAVHYRTTATAWRVSYYCSRKDRPQGCQAAWGEGGLTEIGRGAE